MPKRPELPARSGWTLPPLLLDSVYVAGLLLTLPYLFAIGKGRTVIDHFRRRGRAIEPRPSGRPCLWLHGVSVGEISSARQFVSLFTREHPDWDLVVSATTRAGVEVSRLHFRDHRVISCPFDLSFLVRRAFRRLDPDVVVIVEHDLWPNFLAEARRREVPVAIVNGRLSERSFRGYRRLARWIAWPPPGVVHVCVEDEFSRRGFEQLGMPPERVRVTGNFKFDVSAPASAPFEGFGFPPGSRVFLGASTHAGEEEILLEAWTRLRERMPDVRLVLAPRRDDRAGEVAQLARRDGFETRMWTRRPLPGDPEASILIIDTVGELGRLLPGADVVFVGGSLVPFGGHNVIEPAGVGKPVLTGPHHRNFARVVEAFRENDALEVVRDAGELHDVLRELLGDPARAGAMAARARETVREQTGASQRTLTALEPLLEAVTGKVREPAAAAGEALRETAPEEARDAAPARRPLPTR